MIVLRKATLADLSVLLYWDKQEHVIAADPDDDWNWEKELQHDPEWREQLIAELNGQPIGVIQIIDPAEEETHYWGDIEPNKRAIDIWIGEKENLGKGYGTDMMNQALEICFKSPAVTEVIIDPLETNLKAIAFYKKIGFEFLQKRRFYDVLCDVHTISRDKWMKKI